jgi:hypothetical protein
MTLLHRLRFAARPFVTRSLRGPRGRRAVAVAIVLAICSGLAGLWIALGSGQFEHGVRRKLGLEPSMHQRELDEFMVFCHDDVDCRRIERELENTGEGFAMRLDGIALAQSAVAMHGPLVVPADEHAPLYGRARAALEGRPSTTGATPRRGAFDWKDADDRALLRVVLDAEFRPAVVRYASPLGLSDGIALVGFFAVAMLVLLGTVVGPVMVGIAFAQESHENTLQPVAGTALSPRAIALGMMAGALAPVAIVTVPQLAIAVLSASTSGNPLVFAGFVALLLPCAWALACLSAVVGLYAGRRRGPGLVGIALLAGAGTWALAGTSIGFQALGHVEAALVTMLPSGGLVLAAREAFLGGAEVRHGTLAIGPEWRLFAAAIGAIVVGVLALLAAERRIPGRIAAPLRRIEAMFGSAVLSALTLLAFSQERPTAVVLATLAMMVMPMQLLVMGRVPQGDTPGVRPPVNALRLLGEFASFVALHFALALVIVGPDFVEPLLPATAHLGWALGVAALASLRSVVAPMRLPATLWAGFSFVAAIVTFTTGVAIVTEHGHSPMFALMPLSPWLGAVQVALTVAIPVTLVRAVFRKGGSTPAG